MDPRIQADEFMVQLLAAHGAEDAFVPQPEDAGEAEGAGHDRHIVPSP
jgi:hypothetical protein